MNKFFNLTVLIAFVFSGCSSVRMPYKIVDGYQYVQKEDRRNGSTEWELVWEDNFDNGYLDTTTC